jgi:antitoxin component YwqK of YwqJK toxin-antitoxin module
MKKKLLVLLFVTAIQLLKAQDTTVLLLDYSFHIVENKAEASFVAYVTKATNGYHATIYYGRENIAAEGTFKDKKLTIRNGFFKFYYASTSRIMSEGNFDYNIKNGTWKTWYENKKMKDSGRLYYGMKVGKWSMWHENEQLYTSSKYADSFVTPSSITKGLSKEEKPTAIANYIEQYYVETKIGVWKTYHQNGLPKDSLSFISGEKNGIAKTWYENGQLESVGTFVNDKEEGIWNWYHENGQPATWEKYSKGKVQEMKCYDTAGQLTGTYCSLYKPALFPGGVSKFEEYIKENIQYPEQLKGSNIETVLTCTITINKKGLLSSVKFEGQSLSIFFNKAIEDALYKMPAWEPSVMHNRLQDYTITLQVPFSQEKKE